ncbi:hypothetical protein [Legionella bozemanae]|uniref:Uncharacterized protein n=1 Tax=Legionella bozemanae TaxID=447 RepID=A0A0W0RBX4_LEGBO|nr:hypothetical protein [Legionella bozemanae]KTC68584.1 hypothetical protein Lboz_3367 [Legionella bozemanae]STO33051.1 Uncharacterised protein [Legionella bozemanae]
MSLANAKSAYLELSDLGGESDSYIKVDRKNRRTKTDRLDASRMLSQLNLT